MLQFGLAGSFEWKPMGERNQKCSRGTDLLCGLSEQLQHDRADAASFELRCDQTHGLIADGSDRDEEGDVHLVFDHQ